MGNGRFLPLYLGCCIPLVIALSTFFNLKWDYLFVIVIVFLLTHFNY